MSLLDVFASIGQGMVDLFAPRISPPERRRLPRPKSYDERRRDYERRYEAYWRRWRREVLGEQGGRRDG